MTLVRTSSDSWVNQANPSVNHGGGAKLWMTSAGSNEKLAYVFFNPPFPLGATVFSAVLRVYAAGGWAGTQTLTVKRIVAKWGESTINYNNRPSITATNAGSLVVTGAVDKDKLEIDVSAMMGDVANGSAFFGFQLSVSGSNLRQLRASDDPNAALRPQLELIYSSPPDAPTNLAPGGANVIDLAKPVLAWHYADKDAHGVQTSSQVQISTSSSFASPEYDSGKVANGVNSWDLGATAYAGVPAAATRFWRVKVWDDADLASAYSDPVSFTRTAKGTLTLVNPTGATIDDLTPVVRWSLSGATQEAYRVVVRDLSITSAGLYTDGQVIFDTGRVTDPTTSVAIPAKHPDVIVNGRLYKGSPILNSTDTFQITIHVWDTVDRQGIVGDPSYYLLTTPTFTYVRSGVPAAVTTLTATLPNANSPVVQLDFSRATQPDWFALKVDGKVVAARIDPLDVFVSGTSYRLLYAGSSPRVSHTYEVEAVVNNAGNLQHSAGNATATRTTTPTGIWLIDEDDGTAVRMVGQDDVSMAIGELGTTYSLPNSRAPVRVVDGLRGYEGSWNGSLLSKTDRDTFLNLKGRLKTLRLVLGDLSIMVELEEVAVSPTALPADKLFACSFAFFQVADFTFPITGG